MPKYTDGRGNVFTENEIKSKVWNWYRWTKRNDKGLIYKLFKAEYMKRFGIDELKEKR